MPDQNADTIESRSNAVANPTSLPGRDMRDPSLPERVARLEVQMDVVYGLQNQAATKSDIISLTDNINIKFESIKKEIESQDKKFDVKFASLELRTTSLEEKFDVKFASLEKAIGSLEGKFDGKFASQEKAIGSLEEKFDVKFASQEKAIGSIEKKFDVKFANLEKRFDDHKWFLNLITVVTIGQFATFIAFAIYVLTNLPGK
ncbi:MAG: hypothetical protein LBR80_01795 [Deltaproteobacteria bacterium]|jgi:hypothetical protein|nr:hypothetical protein [Deltaproteobacteria bacterium]